MMNRKQEITVERKVTRMQDNAHKAWICFFEDGVPIYSSFSNTQKSSQRIARNVLQLRLWKECKSRGVRCNQVNIIKLADNEG